MCLIPRLGWLKHESSVLLRLSHCILLNLWHQPARDHLLGPTIQLTICPANGQIQKRNELTGWTSPGLFNAFSVHLTSSGHRHNMQSQSAVIKYYHHGRFSVAGGMLPDAVTAYQTYGDPKNPCIVFPTCYGAKLALGSKSKEWCKSPAALLTCLQVRTTLLAKAR